MIIRFGDFELNSDSRVLRGPDGPVRVEPQVFDVLAYLARHRDRAISKEELLDEVWHSRFVSLSALTSRIKLARRAVGDSGIEQHTIATVSRTGYRFVASGRIVDEACPAVTGGPGPTGDAALRRLPIPVGAFRGRLTELRALQHRLSGERLVTLVGPGGTGKTRLAVELARGLANDEAAVFVDLATVRSDEAVGRVLAGALGIESGVVDDVLEACCAYLRGHRLLLVVDNCEHVAEGAAALVRRILDETVTITLLATSRVPLGLREEHLFGLKPLPLPGVDEDLTPTIALANDAVALFVDRIHQVRRDFELDWSTVGPVVALCSALDGLPLAIELAASRMAVFGIGDLHDRLGRRLDLLRDDRRDTSDRHRTLRATLEWSYELLDGDEQLLFEHLSVFPAGLMLDAIEWLGGRIFLASDPLRVVRGLIQASLIAREDAPSGTRYVQLETMRVFGLDRLESSDTTEAAYDLAAEWGLRLIAEQAATVRSPRERHWNDQIRAEIPNLRVARAHLRRTDRRAELIEISVGLADWSHSRNVTELWVWTDELQEIADADPLELERIAVLAAHAAWARGRLDEVLPLIGPVLERGNDRWARAQARSHLATVRFFQGQLPAAIDASEWRGTTDPNIPELIVSPLARMYSGDLAGARRELGETRRLADQLGWPTLQAWTEYIAGELEWVAGGPGAVAHLEAALRDARELGAEFVAGVAEVTLCGISAASGQTGDAALRYRSAIEHWLRAGMWTVLWTTLRNASTLIDSLDPGLTLLVLDKADSDPYAPHVDPTSRADLDRRRHRAALALGSDTVADLEAAVMTMDRAVLAQRVRQSLLLLGGSSTEA
ncbi:MAG TPA: winged helix-turn-helix domain-containing protein [Acidimicrobiales bacterium]|nr:winged helix-turn-helix domain-containing protein [Acidimicrobiales bacterium]